ncbi:MAG: hypothetical protein INR69_22280 [Mucilaginibacter polytrichastri]|nr:hypothetical protein [Mucilaginibacter polytrichastri]
MTEEEALMEHAVVSFHNNENLIKDLRARLIPSWNIVAKYTRAYKLKEAYAYRRMLLDAMAKLVEVLPVLGKLKIHQNGDSE